jgi:hypothetical protein
VSDTLPPLDPSIRLEIVSGLRTEWLEKLQAARQEFREAEHHADVLMHWRWVLRCNSEFQYWDALYKTRWRETVANRRAA